MNTTHCSNNLSRQPSLTGLIRALCSTGNTESAEFLALCFEIPAGAELPEWLPLIPAGKFSGRDGRKWESNNPDTVVQRFSEDSLDIPVDIEHATELKAPHGDFAGAQGFFKELQNRDGVIWGRVEWNESGRTLLHGKSYRYYSPAFLHDKQGNVFKITSVGLTNRPNLRVPALNHKGVAMLPEIRTALGLPEGADVQGALNAIQKLNGDLQTALNRADQPPSLEQYVPRTEYTTALNRAKTAEDALAENKKAVFDAQVDALLDAACTGDNAKIHPSSREFYKAQCRDESGLEMLKTHFESLPTVAGAADSGLGEQEPPEQQQQTALNAQENDILVQLGLNNDDGLEKFNAIKQAETK